MLVYDLTSRGRFHPATIWGGLFLVASQALRIVAGETAGLAGVREVVHQLVSRPRTCQRRVESV